MKKTLLISILCVAACTLSLAQDDISGKLSITTQMFLDERDGKIEIGEETSATKAPSGEIIIGKWDRRKRNDDRFFASPDTLDGQAYISVFLRLNDTNSTSELESRGTIVQCTFDKGLVTALVPVDSIESVARIANVRRINVASLMQAATDEARRKTNVDDALTQSADAIAAGLSSKYDGTGVVLGVIDTGIDFQHIAFKDANGNSRIKRAYVYNGSKANEYTSITSSSPTTDDKTADHGTHTSSTAGGSSVKVSGNNVTVTNDHSSATYGGMAPGADLYLAGIKDLSSTYMANAFQKICDYADGVGMPVVISNSWGSQFGPHDGTSDFADVTAKYFTDSKPNHICLFAASNDGGKSKDNEGGGYHVSGTASSSKPLGSILRSATYINTDAGYYYYGIIANAWARSSNVSSMACKIFVLDASTGAVKTSVSVTPTTSGASVSGLSSYFSGTLYAYKDYVTSSKTQILLYTSGLTSKGTNTTTKNGETYYTSKYTLAVQFYPTSGSCIVDAWGGTYGYFTNHLTTSGQTWTAGSDDMCVSDEATDPNVISIGAYVTKNRTTSYSGNTTTFSEYTLGDIAYFSSYATAEQSPTGKQYPWICAPGARLVAGINHNHTASVDDYSYYGDSYSSDLVVNSSTNPYAAMEGTSMATPVAAGIVALWLQAATEAGKTLTTSEVKEIMKETAINDSYTTTGPNASHFGNGKIDALAGIQSILGTSSSTPRITATATELNFETTLNTPVTQTFTVTGINLTDKVNVSVSGTDFSTDITSISANDAAAGKVVTITFCPTTAGSKTGTVTLSSTDAEPVTITLTGIVHAPAINVSSSQIDFTSCYETLTYTQPVTVSGNYLTDDITVTLTDESGMFSISQTVIAQTGGAATAEIVITYAPTAPGTHTAAIVLGSTNAESTTINVSGTAAAATPSLSVNPTTLAFSTHVDEMEGKTFQVSGMFIADDVDITLADASGVFSVSPTTLAATSITEGKTVTVTFLSDAEGTYTGTVTLTSGTATATVLLTAEATDGGTASDSYLNIRKYSTMGEAGWTTSYQYTEYEADDVAWLTFPAYDAYKSDNNQVWLTTSVASTTNGSWNATDIFLGSSAYGCSNITSYSSSMWGGGSSTTTETFYVTGCTAVKVYGKNSNSNGFFSSSTSTTIDVFKCTEKADGTLSAASSASKSDSNSSKNATFTLSCTGLDKSDIYKVVVTANRANLYEIAFQAPLPTPVITASASEIALETTVGTPVVQSFVVSGSKLRDAVGIALTDEDNVFDVDVTNVSADDAAAGKEVTITFTPTAEGSYSGMLTLTSSKAETFTVTLTGTATIPHTDIVGDANDDGELNVSDITLIVAYILGNVPDNNKLSHKQLDVNGDGIVDVSDVTALVERVLGIDTQSEE
ncbi:MAG: S8 family serine peptidase [Bacteroidaceae bacterium]|nr:S8 family serine peptidase [Bacteroidaceae bacterium]